MKCCGTLETNEPCDNELIPPSDPPMQTMIVDRIGSPLEMRLTIPSAGTISGLSFMGAGNRSIAGLGKLELSGNTLLAGIKGDFIAKTIQHLSANEHRIVLHCQKCKAYCDYLVP